MSTPKAFADTSLPPPAVHVHRSNQNAHVAPRWLKAVLLLLLLKPDPPLGVPEHIQRLWGQYSPWFPAAEYTPPPCNCNITQLQRHGARYPNEDDGVEYRKSVERLGSARKFIDSRLDFLGDYEYTLGEELLIPFGATQSFEAGEEAYKRYAHLVSPEDVPFVRASDASRVVQTAGNWTVGDQELISYQVNSTLNNYCPNAGSGEAHMDKWLSIFAPPIKARLNKAAPGAHLTNTDVFNLLAMCPFETVATEAPSAFCALFTKDDFRAFEYHGDIEKYYKTGYGEPLGAVQGVGYVNELLARLTDTPVRDHTQTNASLPFPLGRALYADFSHENAMVAVYAALGLFRVDPLDPREMPARGATRWVASRMVPFSTRMVTERVECGGGGYYVRILVNDEVQPLGFCGAGSDGLCTLDAFVESQGYARRDGDGDFEKCYA
ncbi:acid phosphatase [Amylocystis lapponica]|nr:acid phosphatase [Amylocystis lapponica]